MNRLEFCRITGKGLVMAAIAPMVAITPKMATVKCTECHVMRCPRKHDDIPCYGLFMHGEYARNTSPEAIAFYGPLDGSDPRHGRDGSWSKEEGWHE